MGGGSTRKKGKKDLIRVDISFKGKRNLGKGKGRIGD